MKKLIIYIFLLVSVYVYADIPDGYYDSTQGLNGEALKSALHNIIKNHTEYSYDEVWSILQETDEDPSNHNNVRLLYTGWSYSKNNHGGSASQWNREHVWPKSHGNFGTSRGPGTDVHHLRPADVTVNSRRGNLDFDNGGSEYIDGDGATGCNVDSNSWEPRDEVKGDVARMIFYMAVRYDGGNGEIDLEMVDNTNSSGPTLGKMSTLLAWNHQDPPDDFERNRNDIIYSDWQHNRNPFVDYPDFAAWIWEGEAADEDSITVSPITLSAYPNPFNPQTSILFSSPYTTNANLAIYNLKGEKVITLFNGKVQKDMQNQIVWQGDNEHKQTVSSGTYFVIILTPQEKITKTITLIK